MEFLVDFIGDFILRKSRRKVIFIFYGWERIWLFLNVIICFWWEKVEVDIVCGRMKIEKIKLGCLIIL